MTDVTKAVRTGRTRCDWLSSTWPASPGDHPVQVKRGTGRRRADEAEAVACASEIPKGCGQACRFSFAINIGWRQPLLTRRCVVGGQSVWL